MKWRVNIIESERGWGRKIDDVKHFGSEAEAVEFVRTYNAKNQPHDAAGRAPDWYMQAEGPYAS
jgi:hypothetical protein